MDSNNLMVYGLTGIVLLAASCKIVPVILKRRMLNRWINTPKNIVTFHGVARGTTVPMPSPFVLKLGTYLRATRIPYNYDDTDPFGPTGKTPWISYNGEHVGDSQLVTEYLNKKLEKNLNSAYTEEKLAIAHAVRILLEEHFFWGLRNWIFLQDGRQKLGQHVKMPFIQFQLFKFFYGRQIKKDMWAQGLGRHSVEQVEKLMMKDLRSVSKILGKNKFILGDEPCEDDCAIFSSLAVVIWGVAGESPYGKFARAELPNITGYCERMKARFWPDWDEQCAKP